MFGRLLVFGMFAALTAMSARVFFGSTIFASEEEELREIVLSDSYKNGAHELSGIISVPTSCHDLSVRSNDIDARTTVIIFETWEHPADLECDREGAARAVRAVVFAPAEARFQALYDGEWSPLKVVRADR